MNRSRVKNVMFFSYLGVITLYSTHPSVNTEIVITKEVQS